MDPSPIGTAELAEIAELSADAILSLDHEGKIIYFNRSAESLFGYSQNEALGKSMDFLLPDSAKHSHGRHVENFGAGGARRKAATTRKAIHGKTKSGSLVLLDISLQVHPEGSPLKYTAICRDVSSVAAAKKELMENEARLNRAQKIAKVGSWEWDTRDQAPRWSDETYRIIGLDPGSVPASFDTFMAAVHPDDREEVIQAGKASIKNRSPYSIVHRVICPDGERKVVRQVGELLRNPDGSASRWEGTVQDISESWQRKQDLFFARKRALEANHVKTQFLSTVSHELRTPLNAIIGLSAYLVQQGADKVSDEELIELLGHINDSGIYLLKLINNILDVSKLDVGAVELSPSSFTAKNLIEACYQLVAHSAEEKGITLETQVDANLPDFFQDFVRCEQVLLNLLTNAIKFSPNGSEVITEVRRQDAFVTLRVCDSGPGIPAETIEEIFKPFSQADMKLDRGHGGAGLGLAIVKSISETLGGKVEVESVIGKGSTFTVTLPFTSTQTNFDGQKRALKLL